MRSLWYSSRLRGWAAQAALLGGLLALLWWIAGNTVSNMAMRGIRTGFEYLWRPARFPISESVVSYDPSDTFFWAYVVGVTNTLWISFLTILAATILGLFVALARRSDNPLLTRITGGFIYIQRNVPLIVWLLFWYTIATTAFPMPREALQPLPGVFLSLRGVYAPTLELGLGGGQFIFWSALFVIAALVAGIKVKHPPLHRAAWLASCLLIAIAAIWALAAAMGYPVRLSRPELVGLNFRGGMNLSPEFTAIILGLVIYTSAYIGEIIRGGIEAVGKGQWEAGRACGLTERQIMYRVILPQAMRVIVPPMTSQYLGTVKNTTLAVAVGYPELGLVVNTVINQTGQAIESLLVFLCVFLTISLSVSLFMNWYNARVALVTR